MHPSGVLSLCVRLIDKHCHLSDSLAGWLLAGRVRAYVHTHLT